MEVEVFKPTKPTLRIRLARLFFDLSDRLGECHFDMWCCDRAGDLEYGFCPDCDYAPRYR